MAKKGKSRWGKWLTIIVVLLALAIGGFYYLRGSSDEGPKYTTEKIKRGNLVQAVTATGQLGAVTNVQVGSQISGIIKKIYVDYNSHVTNGEVVAEIDPSTYQAAVHQSEGDLESARAALELAQVEARRADELFKDKLISQSDHDTAVAALHQAQATVTVKQAALEQAQVNLKRCTIYAPVDGVVISRNVDVGQTVAASFSTPTLFSIANDLTKMQIDALVSEADIGGVETGQKVNFTVDAYPYRTFHGKVTQVRYGAITNQNVVNYDAVISVNNSDLKLLPGMTANVSIITAERENALKIPNAALRFRPPQELLADVETNVPSQMAAAESPANGGERPRGSHQSGAGGGFGRPGGFGGSFGGATKNSLVFVLFTCWIRPKIRNTRN